MITRNFEITIRIPEQNYTPTLFQVVENDNDVYNLTIHITDGVNEIDYSQISSATITFLKGDGNVVQGNLTVGENSLTYTMGTNEIAHPGTVLASIQLIGASSERLTSARFRFNVVKDLITPSAVQSTTEFPVLNQKIQEVNDLIQEIQGMETILGSKLNKSNDVLESYREKIVNLSNGTIDLSQGNVFVHTLSANTTYTITNAAAQAHSFTLIITQPATAVTLTFPASVKWQGGEIPNMSTVNKTYVLTFVSVNGGTTWLGMFGGEF